MTAPLDYARFGRQIALPQVGAAGQSRLGEVPVAFTGDERTRSLAERLHAGAGGLVRTGAVTVALPPEPPRGRPEQLGVAALGAVEAARRVLGAPPGELPAALLERLTPSTGSNTGS